MRVVVVLTLALVSSACSEPVREAGGWKKGVLAGGRVTFEMPGISNTQESTTGKGGDAIREEKASCEFDSRVFDVRVLSGPFIAKDIGRTPEERRARWAKSFLVDWIQAEPESDVKEEGEWTQEQLQGYWAKVALPPKPPGTPGGRTVPVYIWLHAAAWEDKAILTQFVATQAAAENGIFRGKMERARKRFLASLEVN